MALLVPRPSRGPLILIENLNPAAEVIGPSAASTSQYVPLVDSTTTEGQILTTKMFDVKDCYDANRMQDFYQQVKATVLWLNSIRRDAYSEIALYLNKLIHVEEYKPFVFDTLDAVKQVQQDNSIAAAFYNQNRQRYLATLNAYYNPYRYQTPKYY